MYKEPETMREIHRIQERLYEKMKDMTDREQVEYINRIAEKTERKYNLQLKKVHRVT